MALPPLAEIADLAAWVGQDIAPADPRAGAVLSAASALVRSHTGQTWEDGETPDIIGTIVVQVAARVWMNPAGLVSVTADDTTRRWGDAGASGIYLTASERDALADFAADGRPFDLGTISITRGSLGTGTVYVPTAPDPSGPPFPWYDARDLP